MAAPAFDVLSAALAARYTLERELGRGGMATVYLARDLRHKRPVALKVLHPDLAASLGAERFLREIETAANLTHPHVLTVHDSGEAAGLLYYVMPYVEGESLRDRLRRDVLLSARDALRLLRDVADALAYAHARGVVHRDVKPENILLSGGHAVVADFGVAKALRAATLDGAGGVVAETLTVTGLAVGTPAYMAPEQAVGDPATDHRADLYALGVVAYEALAGATPFGDRTPQATVAAHLVEPPPLLSARRPDLPAPLATLVMRLLEKSPADRPQSSGDVLRELEELASSGRGVRETSRDGAYRDSERAAAQMPADQLRAARGSTAVGGFEPRTAKTGRRLRAIVATVGALGLTSAAAVLAFRRQPTHDTLDANLVAVAPFDVLGAELQLWHEGLVDVLSRNLDGAGPLRTVAPTVVIRRWAGRSDEASAAQLGRATGARLAVFGNLTPSGSDSVLIRATVYDVAGARRVGEVELRGGVARMDRVADSLTVLLLRELGRGLGGGSLRLPSLGSRSLPALKAYLQAEQFYRRNHWDSTGAYAERAIELDSAFGMAFHRAAWARSLEINDSLTFSYFLRAGALNHGLAPRESLLFAFDSVWAAGARAGPGLPSAEQSARRQRLYTTLETALRRYATDPELWYLLGELRQHDPRVTDEARLEAFPRATILDPAFGPAYNHLIQQALLVHGPAAARRHVAAYYAAYAGHALRASRDFAFVDRLLKVGGAASDDGRRAIDSAAPSALMVGLQVLGAWADSAETGVALARELIRRRDAGLVENADLVRERAGNALIMRGRLREQAHAFPPIEPSLFVEDLGRLGILPREVAARTFARALHGPSLRGALLGARWWADLGDTASLAALAERSDSATRVAPDAASRAYWQYATSLARAYGNLARRDTVAALAGFLALPDSVCPYCWSPRLTRAELLLTRGGARDAASDLEAALRLTQPGNDVSHRLARLERGRVAERLGDSTTAVRSYRTVRDAWLHADPELQRYVRAAQDGLERLRAGARATAARPLAP